MSAEAAAIAALSAFTQWALTNLTPAERVVVDSAVRRFAREGAKTVEGFEAADAAIDAKLAAKK